MSETEVVEIDHADAIREAYDDAIEKVRETCVEHGASCSDKMAAALLKAAGWRTPDNAEAGMWEPIATVALKSDLLVVLTGTRATVVRPSTTELGLLERPGHHVDISWGDKGNHPKWVKRLAISRIQPPEGRKP